jgi:hypothetical protein
MWPDDMIVCAALLCVPIRSVRLRHGEDGKSKPASSKRVVKRWSQPNQP